MCTLIAFHRAWEDAPLVLAVNRDEAYGRPSRPPEWSEGSPRILAPRDERAGGTWMGANEKGLWVGVTNRHAGSVEEGRRSRGLLCLDLLAHADPGAVVERVGGLDEPYDPFHLVTGDGRSLWSVEYADGVADAREREPGCWVVTNRPSEEPGAEPKRGRVAALLERVGLPAPGPLVDGARGLAPPDLEARLGRILADHGREGPDALCLHGGRYGTRSAAVWRIGGSRVARGRGRPGGSGASIGPKIRLAFAAGPPCSAPLAEIG